MSVVAMLEPPETKPEEPELPVQLPCWLSEEEAEALIVLCASSPRSAGEVERRLFAKLGEISRAFRR